MSLHASPVGDVMEGALIAIDGSESGWPDAATDALASLPRGILIVRPSASAASSVQVRELHRLATDGNTPVLVTTSWAHPAVTRFASRLRASVTGPVLIDSVAVVEPQDPRPDRDVLLDQLALLRLLGTPVTEVIFASGGPNGYTLNGRAQQAEVALSAVRSATAQPEVRVDLYTPAGDGHLEVSHDGTARPARARVIDRDGDSVLPTEYESAARAAWRRLLETREPVSDLGDLAADLAVVAAGTEGW
jgi:hypothetical protein